MWNGRVETVDLIVADCKMLVQKEYKRKHDKVCLILYWSLCRNFGLSTSEEWYNYVPKKILNEAIKPKILLGFDIQIDRITELRRQFIILHDVENGKCLIKDAAVPAPKDITDKEIESITKYAELTLEMSRRWGCSAAKVKVIPVVI